MMRFIIFILILSSCSHLSDQAASDRANRGLAAEDQADYVEKVCNENLPFTSLTEDLEKCKNQLLEEDIPLFKVVTCSESTTHNSTFLTCLSAAKNEWVSEEKIIACSDVTNFPGSWRNCLKAAQQQYLTPDKILACGETTKTGFLFRLCVDVSGDKAVTVARIRQCEGKGIFSLAYCLNKS